MGGDVALRPTITRQRFGQIFGIEDRNPDAAVLYRLALVEVRLLQLAVGTSHARQDRKSVVSGKSVSVRVDLGGRRIMKKKLVTNRTSNENKQSKTRENHATKTILILNN